MALPQPIDPGGFVTPFGHLASAAACAVAGGFGAFAPKDRSEVVAVALLSGGSACLNPFSPLDTVTPLLLGWLLNTFASFRPRQPARAPRWPWLVLPFTLVIGAEVQWVVTQVHAFQHTAPHPVPG